MVYTEEMTISEILLRLASIRSELLQAVNDIEKISKNICYKAKQTEPQKDCYLCKWLGDKAVCGRCRNRNSFAKAEDEPQTDCGDFVDRLAYERGVKHAWEVAQKVFDSTATFYEAEDVAKQIADTLQTEPSLEQFRVGLEYHTDATHFGKAKGESITTDKTE